MWNFYRNEKTEKGNDDGKLDDRPICSELTKTAWVLQQYTAHLQERFDILLVFRTFNLVVIVLFIAVLHGNALHPSFPH